MKRMASEHDFFYELDWLSIEELGQNIWWLQIVSGILLVFCLVTSLMRLLWVVHQAALEVMGCLLFWLVILVVYFPILQIILSRSNNPHQTSNRSWLFLVWHPSQQSEPWGSIQKLETERVYAVDTNMQINKLKLDYLLGLKAKYLVIYW